MFQSPGEIAFTIGHLDIYYYGIIMAFAIFCGLLTILGIRKYFFPDILKDRIFDISFILIICGILGARLYYVLLDYKYFLKFPYEIPAVWHGGISIQGAIAAGIIAGIIYVKKHKINFFRYADLFIFGLVTGQIIGRWGNFFNGEAFGRVVSLEFLQNLHLPQFIINGMYIDGLYREPTFLYESIFSIIGFILLIIVRKNKKLKLGQLTGIYLIWYGLERLIIEIFRSDSLMLGTIKIAQLVSLIAIVSGIVLLIKAIKNKKNYHEVKIFN